LHALITGRPYRATFFLATAHSFVSAYAFAKRTHTALSYGFCENVYMPVEPTRSVLVIHISTRVGAKTIGFWGRPQNNPCSPDFPVHTRWVAFVTSL